ncbi:MAG: AAA family ATPase [bacterium]
MPEPTKRSLFGELKRRHVFAVGAVYFVGVWGLIQVADIVLPAFGAPEWTMQVLIVAGVAGFPLALIVTWIFDITPKGVVRTSEVDAADAAAAGQIQAASPEFEETTEEPADEDTQSQLTLDERRHITVLVADIGPSGDDADPEWLLETGPAIEQACSSVVGRYSGHVQRQDQSSLVVYFGYPEAHEDDSRRAVQCGLALCEALNRLFDSAPSTHNTGLRTCIGIDSGLALIETQGPIPQVLEHVTSRALWAGSQLSRTGVIMTATTAAVVRGYFDQTDLGAKPYSASQTPIPLFQVQHESGARNRVEARERLVALSGRNSELEMLQRRWQHATQGSGQVALITGEAGMGKSRLLYELKQHVAKDPSAWITECACSSEFANRPLYPIIDMLSRNLFKPTDDDAVRLLKLEGVLTQFGFQLDTQLPLFADLLDISYEDHYALLQLAPKLKKERSIQAFIDLMLARAQTQPLLLVVEDLHWADASFLDLIRMLVELGPTNRILVICTTRPSLRPEWSGRTHVTNINLTPLTSEEIRAVIAATAQGSNISAQIMAHLIEHAQGNPLYAEELTSGYIQSYAQSAGASEPSKTPSHNATHASSATVIPATLQESLLARLDVLQGEVKTVAKISATLGPRFKYPLLAAFAESLHVADLDNDLRSLVDADIFYQRGTLPDAEFSFKHILVQEAAYQTLLKKEREHYHQQIADILQNVFAEECAQNPQIPARHLSAARNSQAAVPLWYAAGRQAAQQSAPVEASYYLQEALSELQHIPPDESRNALELDIQIALGPVLIATRGYSSAEVKQTYERAVELCETSTASARLAPPIFGLWSHRVVAGELGLAVELGDKLHQVAVSAQSDDLLLESHVLSGVTLSYTGPMRESLRHMDAAIEMYDKSAHAGHAYTFGQDPLMAAMSYRGIALWWLGLPVQAGDAADRAIDIARELGHARSLAFALANATRCHLKRGAYERCITVGEEGIELCAELGFPDFRAMADFHLRAAQFAGNPDRATSEAMEQALTELKQVGNSLSMPFYHCQLAQAHTHLQNYAAARSSLQHAEAALVRHGCDSDEVEVRRVRAELLIADPSGNSDEGIVLLNHALQLATDQGAAAWALATATTLHTCCQTDQSAQQLANARSQVTEGDELPLQHQADQLLAKLTT